MRFRAVWFIVVVIAEPGVGVAGASGGGVACRDSFDDGAVVGFADYEHVARGEAHDVHQGGKKGERTTGSKVRVGAVMSTWGRCFGQA